MSPQASCCEPSAEDQARYSASSHLLQKLAVQGRTLEQMKITGCWAVLWRLNRTHPDAFPHPIDLVDRFVSSDQPGAAVALVIDHPLVALRPLRGRVELLRPEGLELVPG